MQLVRCWPCSPPGSPGSTARVRRCAERRMSPSAALRTRSLPETQTTRLTAGPLPLPRLCASPTPIQFQLPVPFVSIAPECLYSLLFTQYSLRFTALPRPRWR